MRFDDLATLLLDWPHVEAGTSYGTPALKVKGKLLVRLREDDDSLVLFEIPPEEREMLIETEPELFYFTDHYRNHPMILARLSQADADRLLPLVKRRYERLLAPKKRARR